jgi:non-specific serine/threonine protein kinase
VTYVPLAGVTSADLLARTIADALGVLLSSRSDPVDGLVDYLRRRNCLLVLDNFEQIAEAASTLDAVCAEAPNVRVLVTSRERLNLSREVVFELGGLGVASGDAVELFAARAATRSRIPPR